MTVLLAQLRAQGVEIEPAGNGGVRVRGRLTDDLRTIIRANKPQILAELSANDPRIDGPVDPDVTRRRAKALALLDEEPSRRLAIVAEAPKAGEAVGYVCTAVRCVAVGDIAIPADKYDAFALLALMEVHGHA